MSRRRTCARATSSCSLEPTAMRPHSGQAWEVGLKALPLATTMGSGLSSAAATETRVIRLSTCGRLKRVQASSQASTATSRTSSPAPAPSSRDLPLNSRLVTIRLTSVTVLVVLVISACKLPSASTAHSPSPTTHVELAWTDCADGFQCATLQVPLDYSHTEGRQISLAL